jgi:segregation and condensation protein A
VTATAPRTTTSSSIEGYQLRLPVYEGPLDVLLRLIERNQLEITDVSLVEVTDQFIKYVAHLPATEPVMLAEFAAIASRLLVLKSRSLLPVDQKDDEEIESDDLTSQLLAYKAVRDAAQLLDDRQRQALNVYGRPPSVEEWGETTESLRNMPANLLVRAWRRCVHRQIPEPTTFRPRPVISLADMVSRIVDRLRIHGRTRFSSLLSRGADRHEHVAGFIALLTLWKQRTINVLQREQFGEIEVHPVSVQEQVADD